LHLDVDTQSDREASQGSYAGAAEILACEDQPHGNGDEGGERRVEQEHVKHRDEQG
jgi:hypothetical protein